MENSGRNPVWTDAIFVIEVSDIHHQVFFNVLEDDGMLGHKLHGYGKF